MGTILASIGTCDTNEIDSLFIIACGKDNVHDDVYRLFYEAQLILLRKEAVR